MIVVSLILASAGFAALAAAMRRHAKQIGLLLVPPARLRFFGCVFLVASFAVLLDRMDWRMATIAWIGQAAVAAAMCVVTLSIKIHSASRQSIARGRADRLTPRNADRWTSAVNAEI